MVSTGTSAIGSNSTIARFSDRAIIPSTVKMTVFLGCIDLSSASTPSMLASESGSGFTWETSATRPNGASVASNWSHGLKSDRSELDVDFAFW